MAQLPTGSCVLKLGGLAALIAFYAQLPTGSCVLKQLNNELTEKDKRSYLRELCVETSLVFAY